MKVKMSLTIDKSLYVQIRRIAENNYSSMSATINILLHKCLTNEERKEFAKETVKKLDLPKLFKL
jgi:hypothetical protein